MINLASYLVSKLGLAVDGLVPCPKCGTKHPLFALTRDSQFRWRCGHCHLDAQREAVVEPQPEPIDSWTGERGLYLKAERNRILNDQVAWTFRADSPLTQACQAEWIAYARLLNRMTVDATPLTWQWPEQPALVYE